MTEELNLCQEKKMLLISTSSPQYWLSSHLFPKDSLLWIKMGASADGGKTTGVRRVGSGWNRHGVKTFL